MAHLSWGAAGLTITLVVALAQGASERGLSVSAVQKVIQLLQNMEVKAKKEKHDEEVAFAKFDTWCTGESRRLETEIQQNAEEMELLAANIEKLESDIKTLGEELAELETQTGKDKAAQKAEMAQRTKDREAFDIEEKDYAESVDALERAIAVLQKQAYDRVQDREALLQLSENTQLPEKAKTILAAFLGINGQEGIKEDPDYLSVKAPEANAYEFQSGSIVALLKRLRDDFREKLSERQKEEMNSKHAHDMMMQDLTDSVENAEKTSAEKTMQKQLKAEDAANGKKQLASTTALKAENTEMLKATRTECTEKQLSFEEKQKLRAEELDAMAKAIEILSSPEVLGAAEQHLSLMQPRAGATALVQAASRDGGRSEGINRRVREFLAAEGVRLHSQRLGLLAQQLAADPFVKVKKMIEEMINRLLGEAHAEIEHKGFCDKELGKSKITRTELGEAIERLSAAVEDGKANIAELGQSNGVLAKEVAEISKAMSDATALREEESAANAATLKDAKAAQAAVQDAMAVLKDFYAKALTATAFLQQTPERAWGLKKSVKMGSEEWNALGDPSKEGTVDTGHKEGMQTFGDVEQGAQDEANGVLALLEVIQSDFANLEANTKSGEAESQKTFNTFMVESKKNKAVKERAMAMNEADKAAAETRLLEDTNDLKATQDQLLAANRYYDNLKPQCLDQGMSYEERTRARQEEIQSLKEALRILSNDDVEAES